MTDNARDLATMGTLKAKMVVSSSSVIGIGRAIAFCICSLPSRDATLANMPYYRRSILHVVASTYHLAAQIGSSVSPIVSVAWQNP